MAILLLRWDPARNHHWQWQVMNGGIRGWARAAPALRTLAHIVWDAATALRKYERYTCAPLACAQIMWEKGALGEYAQGGEALHPCLCAVCRRCGAAAEKSGHNNTARSMVLGVHGKDSANQPHTKCFASRKRVNDHGQGAS